METNNPVKTVYMVDINALPKKDMSAEEILRFAKEVGHQIISPLTSLQSMIDELPSNERGKISDGYHTFDELYDHRITLFIALCKVTKYQVWKSRKHSDGSEWEGLFILGINKEAGHQITYHLPISRWDEIDCDVEERAPEWDGHSSADVLKRLKEI